MGRLLEPFVPVLSDMAFACVELSQQVYVLDVSWVSIPVRLLYLRVGIVVHLLHRWALEVLLKLFNRVKICDKDHLLVEIYALLLKPVSLESFLDETDIGHEVGFQLFVYVDECPDDFIN